MLRRVILAALMHSHNGFALNELSAADQFAGGPPNEPNTTIRASSSLLNHLICQGSPQLKIGQGTIDWGIESAESLRSVQVSDEKERKETYPRRERLVDYSSPCGRHGGIEGWPFPVQYDYNRCLAP